MVGTLSLKKENMIYMIVFHEQIKTGTFREKKFRPANALFFLLNIFVHSSDIRKWRYGLQTLNLFNKIREMNKEHLDTHWISTKYSQDLVMLIFFTFT